MWLTRTGVRQDVDQGFVRIDLRSRRLTTVPADLAGRVARDDRGRFWYVHGPERNFEAYNSSPHCTSQLAPCQLVQASASPFS